MPPPERWPERFEASLSRALATRIEPLKCFHPAEDYHQKYYLRNDRVLMADFRAMFDGDETSFRESTAAARVNGYAAGGGTRVGLAGEVDLLGLSEKGLGPSRLQSALTHSFGTGQHRAILTWTCRCPSAPVP